MTPIQAAALAAIESGAATLRASLEDTPPPPSATYELSVFPTVVSEGESLSFVLATTNVAAGATVPYRLQGAVNAADLVGVPMTGVFTVEPDGTAQLSVPTSLDEKTEGDETIEMVIDLPGVIAHASATVLDASLDPPPPQPTYTLTVAPASVAEGETLVFTLNTTNLAPGAAVPYRLQGAINAADIGSAVSGVLTLNGAGSATLSVATIADALTEGDEAIEMVLDLPGVAASAQAMIRDTSTNPVPPIAQRFVEPLDASKTIAIKAWFYGTTYDRNARFVPITTDTWPCEFYAADYAANGLRPCSVRDYNLLVDGVLHASVTLPVGAMGGTITLRASELADGWHLLRVVPAGGTETSIPCAVYVRRGAVAPAQTWMYVQAASHDHLTAYRYQRTTYAKVPAAWAPTVRPLPVRDYPAFSTSVPRGQLFAQDIVIHRPGDCYRTRLSQGAGLGAGVLNAAQMQAYYWSYMVSKYPGQVALLDGPRGCGSVAMATHLQFGRLGGIYFTDPWRFGLISPDGTVQTIAGYRQPAPARLDVPVTATSSANSLELVGDWSAIPAERRGFHELWGLAFDSRTLATDTAAAPIPNGTNPDGSVRMERPHVAPGPVAFLPDSQNNRIVRVQRSFDSHATPAVVTEFIVGLGDPWDCVCVDGVLYVSERISHRIAAYDATTGALIRVVVSGLPLASLNTSIRRMQRNAGVTLADVRAQPCVAPEGLYYLDGWLYFGSLVQQQVRRVHLVTGALEVVVPEPYIDQGSNFFKLAVSSGSFGPAGTVFLCTFAGAGYGGRPAAYLPSGAQWDYGWAVSGEGPGRVWESVGYACAVAVGSPHITEGGAGRMAHASSDEGVWLVGRTQPGDGAWGWARMQALHKMWHDAGWHLTHGPGGWGYYGLPLPWGVNADIDDYLTACGHARGG